METLFNLSFRKLGESMCNEFHNFILCTQCHSKCSVSTLNIISQKSNSQKTWLILGTLLHHPYTVAKTRGFFRYVAD